MAKNDFLVQKRGNGGGGGALLLIQYKLTLFGVQIRDKLPSVFKIDLTAFSQFLKTSENLTHN